MTIVFIRIVMTLRYIGGHGPINRQDPSTCHRMSDPLAPLEWRTRTVGFTGGTMRFSVTLYIAFFHVVGVEDTAFEGDLEGVQWLLPSVETWLHTRHVSGRSPCA